MSKRVWRMPFLLELAWRDLRASGRSLWIFCACLVLGVSLVAAGGGLYRQVAESLRSDARQLFGGDLEVEDQQPLDAAVLDWMNARGSVSRLVELRTMLRPASGNAQLVELQSADERYPLYGEVTLDPPLALDDSLALRDGRWGAAVDAALSRRMGLVPGDRVMIGNAELEVRALIARQPDRSLRADWSGAPVLVSDGGLDATGLVQPLSRVEYHYRVRTDEPVDTWRSAFVAAFPGLNAEVRTFEQRSERMAEVLGQIGSGLLLIGFSALFIGGMGVFNSVHAYLQGKLASLATLRALGMRDSRLARMVLMQILMLAGIASFFGVLLGNAFAVAGVSLAADKLPVTLLLSNLWQPSLLALAFGLLTAMTFALPALGRALAVSPASLFRGPDATPLPVPRKAWIATAAVAVLALGLLVVVMPDPRFGLLFLGATALMLASLEGIVRLLKRLAARLQRSSGDRLPLAAQMALAGLQQPASPLRAALLSLGTALTLLVACTLVVASLLRAVNETVPENAPALVLYDVQTEQLGTLNSVFAGVAGPYRLQTAPLVLGRLAQVNGEALRESLDGRRAMEARDEQKLSHRAGNIDDVVVERGAWWPASYQGPPLVAMEDREADQLGLKVGDSLVFDIMGTPVPVQLAAIYAQRRMQSRIWLEAIFSDGVLDPFITRHVGAAWLPADQALTAQDRLSALAPNIASVRTEGVLQEARALMTRAVSGLTVVAGVCLLASLLVLASVVAANRSRQIYDATVMHALGARLSTLRSVLLWEYLLLAVVTAGFATLAGGALATLLLMWRLDLNPAGLYWSGVLIACAVSVVSLGMAARYLLAQMRLNPAALLRSGG